MEPDELIAQLTLEARRVPALEPTALDAPVPWCGEWRVGDVIGHLSGVQRWATVLCTEPGTRVRRRDLERAPEGAGVLPWYEAGIDPMLGAFVGADLEVAVHTWAGEQPRRWWLRRLLHETAVHRWDTEAAATSPDAAQPIDAEVAVDGIDELLDNFLPLVDQNQAGIGGTMHLHATDATGEWLMAFTEHGVVVERVHARGDVAVRGTAADLLLLLWNRRSVAGDRYETFGDVSLVERWHQAARF